jgi:hypothetical protein
MIQGKHVLILMASVTTGFTANRSIEAIKYYGGNVAGVAAIYRAVDEIGGYPVKSVYSVDDLPDFADYSMENRTYRYFTGTPVFPFGHGLSYADIHEQWIDAKTVELTNESEIDTAYAVLRYADAPDRHLIGFEKVFIKAKERKTVVFER